MLAVSLNELTPESLIGRRNDTGPKISMTLLDDLSLVLPTSEQSWYKLLSGDDELGEHAVDDGDDDVVDAVGELSATSLPKFTPESYEGGRIETGPTTS